MLDDIKAERLKKLEVLKKAGMDPYPATTKRSHTIGEALTGFDAFAEKTETLVLAGRIMSRRGQGALTFVDVFDGTGRIQMVLKLDEMDEAHYALFQETADQGDFVEFSGTLFVTQRGQQSLQVVEWRMLTKTLLPLPDEWYGIKDDDERYRKRYLDILMNTEVRQLFDMKAKFWKASRDFLEEKGFAEVHTPTLESTTGGAEANPFVTHHKDYNIDVFLRISVGELWQKRLMASGIPRIFEVGRVYRNEGSSPDHLQEFTNIEFYAAFMNFDEGLALLEEHILYVLDHAFEGKREFEMKGFTVNFTPPFGRIDYVETIKEKTGIDVVAARDEEIQAKVEELGIEYEGDNRERLTDTLWKYCRKSIAGPVWLTGHPTLVSPLSKESEEKPGTVYRAQLIMAGAEFNNCFAELNDPVDQRARFELQEKLIERGDEEAMMPDWEFVEALEYGIPPTFGAATLGERFFAYLVDKPIRETQYFPLMRPKKNLDAESDAREQQGSDEE